MPKYTYHDAKTGEFVEEEYANDHPDTTVRIEARAHLELATPLDLLMELSRRAAIEGNRRAGWLTEKPEVAK